MQSGLTVQTRASQSFPSVTGSGAKMDDPSAKASETYRRVIAQLKAQLGADVYSSWFGRMKLAESAQGYVRLSVPTAFLKSWISGHYIDTILDIWKKHDPSILRVDIIIRSATRAPLKPPSKSVSNIASPDQSKSGKSFAEKAAGVGTNRFVASSSHRTKQPVVGSPLDARYTFETYVEGPPNRVALAAGRSVAEGNRGNVRFNPLFIHAAVGLGKTHLLQAIANEALRQNPQTRVVYLTAEYFMWRFATAIRDNNALTLKEQLRDIDLLIIDDMQFLQGKSIQHEFCHLINTLLDSAKQVVVAADRPPAELDSLEPRIRSRLNGGVALEMSTPDYEMRLKMLQLRMEVAAQEDHTSDLPAAILQHVAKTVVASGRELEGAFNQILVRNSIEPGITLERVDELLANICRTGEPKRVRIEDIQRIVARHYSVSKTELLSNRRTRTIVRPRQIAMYLSKVLTPRSLPEIGRRFGGRDHTTVLHAVRKIENNAAGDDKLAQELELLKRLINDQA